MTSWINNDLEFFRKAFIIKNVYLIKEISCVCKDK